MSGAWKLPMSPAQANSRGFYFGPSGEAPWNCDLMWKHHVHGENKIQAKHRLRSAAATRPHSAVPWGVEYDASMETWSPFSTRAEIPLVRPRTAVIQFRKTLARHPAEGLAWEAEHGKRNIFKKIEQLRTKSPRVHGDFGESELQVEFGQSLIANTDLEKTIQWAQERVEARARERNEEEIRRISMRERQNSLKGHQMGGVAADNAAWMNADRKSHTDRLRMTNSSGGLERRIANSTSYEALLGRKETQQAEAHDEWGLQPLPARATELSPEVWRAEALRGPGLATQPRTAGPYVRLVSGERIMVRKEKFLSVPKNLESENQELRSQLKDLQERVLTANAEVKRLNTTATPLGRRGTSPPKSPAGSRSTSVINVWRAEDEEGSELPESRASRRRVVVKE
mmetsp:Transcript_9287/g.14651  ORF Transcript_9287/g.14651 Transcript_9287/m.14651 type:complete len:399 (+) Transcript_9287:167-1363(+)